VGDVIAVRSNSRGNAYFKEAADRLNEAAVPEWLDFDAGRMSARVVAMPDRQAVDLPLNEQLIVEYYSR
jgi:small subunit ribosomal protein S4